MQKFTFFLWAFLCCSVNLSAQTETTTNLSSPSIIQKGRILTTEGYEILFTNLSIESGNYQYQTTKSPDFLPIEESQIIKIETQNGSEAMKWAAGTGGAVLVLGFLRTSNPRYNLVENETKTTLVIGTAVASALVGGLIGSSKKKYKTVYENPRYKDGYQSFQLQLTPIKKGGMFAFKYQF